MVMIETSVFLAKILGLLGAVATLTIMINYKDYLKIEENAVKNSANIYLSGFLFLIFGVLLIIGHQLWVWDWRVIITIIGWLIFAKGIIRIFFPKKVKKLIQKKRHNRVFFLAEFIVFIISLYLIYRGFFVH